MRFDFGNDWELVDRFNYTSGDADTVGLVPGGEAVNVSGVEPESDSAALEGYRQTEIIGK